MENTLAAFSAALAAAVASAGRAVVSVQGRERMPSSGIHYSPGVVVTADHAIRRTEALALRLAAGTAVAAARAGRDAGTDLAVLKAELGATPVAERAPAPPRPGQVALVVGRLAEVGLSASMGVVSAVGPRWRTWRGGMIDSFVRLDAAVYPGSSGGAVTDTEGRLLGMATSGLSRVAPVAVPVTTLERVVAELLATGRVSRGYLGVGLQPVALPEALRGKLQSGQSAGLIILNVEPGGPAEKAGLLIGDILIALDGAPVAEPDDVQQALGGEAIGRSVKAALLRGGEVVETAVTVGERPRRTP